MIKVRRGKKGEKKKFLENPNINLIFTPFYFKEAAVDLDFK